MKTPWNPALFFGALASLLLTTSLPISAAETVQTPQAIEAPAGSPWQHIAASIDSRARDQGITTVSPTTSQAPIRLFVETSTIFRGDSREISPAFADLLSALVTLMQGQPDARISVLGYGDNPAVRYNPVLLGLRVRRLRTFLANQGMPFKQIKASVKNHEHYDGPVEFAQGVATGRLIELRFHSR